MEDFSTDRLKVMNWRLSVDDQTKRQGLETALSGILTPKVLEHLPEPLQLENTNISHWIDARSRQSNVYLVNEIASDKLVGLLILAAMSESEGPHQVHFGYLFAEPCWGKGYASELISGFVSAMFPHAPVHLLGGVGLQNKGSARVLEKNNFEVVPELSTDDTEMFIRKL